MSTFVEAHFNSQSDAPDFKFADLNQERQISFAATAFVEMSSAAKKFKVRKRASPKKRGSHLLPHSKIYFTSIDTNRRTKPSKI